MPVTALYLVQDPSINATTITSVSERITRLFPRSVGKWGFEYKLYRENPMLTTHHSIHSLPSQPGSQQQQQQQHMPSTPARFLAQLYITKHRDDLFCLIDEPHGGYTSSGAAVANKAVMAVFDKGMDSIVATKLQSLWTLRQTMRGEGFAYSIGDEFVVRVASVTMSGSFRFIVIEVEYLKSVDLASSKQPIADLIAKCDLPRGKFVYGEKIEIYKPQGANVARAFTKIDNALQYVELLRSGPNG
ncbi:mediator complex, subunit Med20 [Limtongia smithiae]|uniref:mediator complex, subunit Med20 n=1 Tax=Limtongia smithiae TaxID=1125753 RepID=UPI0034CF7E57